jgi:predicted GIY-YIG superfamily endonuclease
MTQDLQKLVTKHSKGDVLATKGKRTVKLVFYCALTTKNLAIQFEQYLKTGSDQAFRNRHLTKTEHS